MTTETKTYLFGKVWRSNNEGGIDRSVMLGLGETPAEAKDLKSQGVSADKKDLRGCKVYEVVSGAQLAEDEGDFADVVLEEDVVFWQGRGNGMENVVVVKPV